MRTRTFLLLPAILLIAWGAVTATAHSQSSEVEVRVAAQRLDDGRTEFALQERQADGAWGERRLPRSRFFPASATVDRWLASSALSVAGVEVRIATRLVADGRMEFALQERQADGEWGERRLPRSRFFPAGAAVGRWLASSALTVRAPTLDVDVDVVQVEVRIATQLVLDGRMEFALQERQADGEWGERRLPRSRFFPATPAVGRWLASSALTVSAPGAGSDAVGVEVRLAAQRVADGRTEFALQERQADGAWGERQLPRSRFFPASATVGRWLASSPLTLSVPAAAPSPPSTAPAAPGTPESDRAALVALYEATDGENWTDSTNWLSDRPIGEWHRVSVGGDGRVRALSLTGNGLSGPIPAQLGELTGLWTLLLERNELSGPIPTGLGGLSSLRLLSLSSNRLTGLIPAELGELTSLRSLFLGRNELSGSIPAELGELTSLRSLFLGRNELSGSIPAELSALSNLQGLFLSENELSGCIPDGLRGLVLNDLDALGLPFCPPDADTSPTSPGPPEADRAALVALYEATDGANWTDSTNWLSDRPIREWHGVGTRGPRVVADVGRVTLLRLSNNQLSGPVPVELASLGRLRVLDLSRNQLSGPIPAELGGLSDLGSLSLSSNSLSGPIPAELGDLSNLGSLSLSSNSLSGPIPAELGRLTGLVTLDLRMNQLSGPIPADLGNLTNVSTLALFGNELSGCIPEGLWYLEHHFGGLGLSFCGPPPGTPALPPGASAPPTGMPGSDRAALVALYEATDGANWTNSTNWLSDRPLREWHGVSTNSDGRVTSLFLRANGLSGSLPTELASLTELELLLVGGNEFTGCISDGLAHLQGRVLLPLPSCSRAALVALYNATDGPNWNVNTNWLSLRPINEWAGVYTDRFGRVSSLSLSRNGLNGPIPAELAGLAGLRGLYLDANDLSGPIPAWLGNLAGLELLTLSGNELSGPIPPALGSLADLEVLHLSGNQLSGPIPAELAGLGALRQLSLSGNQLSGRVPAWLGNLRGLNELHLSSNELSGPIPTALGNLSDLRELGLGANELDGMIPAELGGLTRLTWLALGRNDLSGPIPPALGSLTNLEQLQLAGNNLSGPIPGELDGIAGLGVLSLRVSLDGNEFTGCVPDSWRDVPHNDVARLGLPYCGTPDAPPPASDWHVLLALHETMGSGANWRNDIYWLSELPIGSWYGVTTDSSGRITELALDDNDLSGPIPGELLAKLTNLVSLDLTENELSGPIPAELGMLSNLETLLLNRNSLSGPIPAELGMLSNLGRLSLFGNELSGPIPAELGMLSNLGFLSLWGNELSGPIPAELGMLSNLGFLSLWGNELSGPIPAELGNLTSLVSLVLAQNQLSGSIPAELGMLSSLERLLLSGNELSGRIPAELGNLTSLVSLVLTQNQLTGSVPAQLSGLPNLESLSLAGNPLSGCIPVGLRDLEHNDFELLGLPFCEP